MNATSGEGWSVRSRVALSAAGARADVLNDWNVIAQNQAIPIRPTAHGQTRGMAMVQGAVYDAVNAIDPKHEPYLLNLAHVGAQPFASQDAAIATAAHHVLVAIVEPARVAELDTAYAATLAAIPDGRRQDEGVDAGEAAAKAMLDARSDDGYMATFTLDHRARRGRLAADDGDGARPRRLGRQPEAVRDPEPVAVPLEGTERAHERARTRRTSTR